MSTIVNTIFIEINWRAFCYVKKMSDEEIWAESLAKGVRLVTGH
jgi:hypothetical protein